MTNENQFEKSLNLTKITLLLSGINIYKTQWHPILEMVVNKLLYYFNIVILYSVIFAEMYWLFDGIQIGRDFVEMSLTAPCITISILSTLKSIPLYFKKDVLCNILDTLKEIHPEDTDYDKSTGNFKKKEDNTGNLKKKQDNTDSVKPNRDTGTIDSLNLAEEVVKQMIAKELAKAETVLKLVGFLLYTISIAVLITFLLEPLILIYWEYYTTGEMKIQYPFSIKYWFDAYAVRFWPLVYFQQVWATVLVCLNIFGTETLFCSLCTFIEMHFRILCYELESIQAGSGTQELLVAGVRKHKLLIDLVEQTEKLFSQAVLFHIVSSSILICLSAFNITVAEEIGSVFAFVTFLLLTMSQVSLLCFFGDKLMRSSTEVSGAIYKTPWYEFSVIEKKAVLIIMIRAQKPCKLTASNFADVNLRAFTTILSRSWSYFALLKTVYN